MTALLFCLIIQLDTLEVKFSRQVEILRTMPEQADMVVDAWVAGGSVMMPYLIRSFTDPETNLFLKEKIALTFGRLADKTALPHLYRGLAHAGSQLKANIARALGEMPDPASFEYLLPLLKDPNDAVRGEAIFALGRLGDQRAVSYLIEALKDSVFMNRGRALIAFGDLHAKEMLPYLAVYRTDPLPQMRMALAVSLGKYRDTITLPLLEPLISDSDPVVRREAYVALSMTPGSTSVARFRTILTDSDPQVRDAGVTALLNYPPETILPILYEFLWDGNPSVRAAAQALFENRRSSFRPGLERILIEDYPREMKHWSLRQLVIDYGVSKTVDRLMQIFPGKFRDRLLKIVNGEYEIGMDQEEVYLSLGKPSRTRSMGGNVEEWDYDDLGLIFLFQGGVLTETEGL